jgi:hypothetical protein
MYVIYSIYFRYIYIPRESIPLSISGYVYTVQDIAFRSDLKKYLSFRNAIFRGIIATERCCFSQPLKVVQLFQLRLSASKAESRIRARKALWESQKKSLIFSDSQQAFRARIRLFRFDRGQS